MRHIRSEALRGALICFALFAIVSGKQLKRKDWTKKVCEEANTKQDANLIGEIAKCPGRTEEQIGRSISTLQGYHVSKLLGGEKVCRGGQDFLRAKSPENALPENYIRI